MVDIYVTSLFVLNLTRKVLSGYKRNAGWLMMVSVGVYKVGALVSVRWAISVWMED